MDIPSDYTAFLQLSPDAVQALADELVERPLSPENIDQWLRDWAALGTLFQESLARLDIAVSVNTADADAAEKRAVYRRTIWSIGEQFAAAMDARLDQHRSILPPVLLSTVARTQRTQSLNQTDELRALLNQEDALVSEYAGLLGAQSIDWEGQTLTDRQARGLLSSESPSVREGVWRALMMRRRQDREAIGELWRKLLDTRQSLAEKNGFRSYIDYRWQEMERDDYAPDDSRALDDAFLKHWSPLYARIMARRAAALGRETLPPWDVEAPFLGQPLKPFSGGAELTAKVGQVFQRLDSEWGSKYRRALDLGFLDIAMREHTAPVGGFARAVGRGGVFVMLNVSGTRIDVENLIHEMGHAFSLVASCKQPYHQHWGFPYDFGETPSSVMEMLSMPYWEECYQGAALAQAKKEYFSELLARTLEEVILEAFQFWVYSSPDEARQPARCDAKWLELHTIYMPGVDWRSAADEASMGWQRSGTLFYAPLFAIAYTYGRLAGLKLMKRADAVDRYKSAVALGNSVPAKALFAALGSSFFFTADDVALAAKDLEAYLMG